MQNCRDKASATTFGSLKFPYLRLDGIAAPDRMALCPPVEWHGLFLNPDGKSAFYRLYSRHRFMMAAILFDVSYNFTVKMNTIN